MVWIWVTTKPSAEVVLGWPFRVVAAVLLIGASLITPTPATADLPGVDPDVHPTYQCDGTAYLMLNGTYSTVSPDPANPGSWIATPVPVTTTIGNSLGYDPVSNYVYGTAGNNVEIYDAAGGLVSSVPLQAPWPTGASLYSGTVLGDGTYIVGSWGRGNGTGWYGGNRYNLWIADPQTGAITHIGSTPRSEADFSYNPLDGYLYHASGGFVTRWDPITAAEVRIDVPGWSETGFGGSWFDAAGNLYLYKNGTGEIWQISDPGGSPTASLVGTSSTAGGVDATSCVGETDLLKDVVDSAGNPVPLADRTYRPGEIVTYAFTLINNAIPTGPQPLTVCDTFGDGRTFTGNFSDPTGTATFDTPLGAGDTSMCMTVDVPSSLWTDPYTPGGSPVTVTIDVQIPPDFVPGEYENQAWLDIDGDRTTAEVLSDDPGDLSDGEDPTTVEVTGKLEVWKEVFGHPTNNDTDNFLFTVTCTNPDATVHEVQPTSIVGAGTQTQWPGASVNSFTLTNGDRVDIWDLPAGASCVTSETTGPYYPTSWSDDSGSVGNSASTTNIIDQPIDSEQARLRNYTSIFTVTKATNVPDSAFDLDPLGQFDVQIECESLDGTIYSQNHTITVDTATGPASATGTTVDPALPLLPHATLCSVTETVPTGWELTASSGTTFTTSWTTARDVSLTNTMQVADLTINKTIVGLPPEVDPADFSFEVTTTCSGDSFASEPAPIVQTLTPGSPAVISDLPVGANCTVVETPDPSFTTAYSVPGGVVDVVADGSTLDITNTTGTFIIEKFTTVDSDHPIDPYGTFLFDIECSLGGAVVYTGTHSLTTDTATSDGSSGGITYDELPLLPPGSECVITEQDPGSEWTQQPSNGPLTIAIDPAEPNTATFTNQRNVADVTITKEIVGAPPGLDLSSVQFDVSVACTGGFEPAGAIQTFDGTITAATDFVVEDLPVGTTCAVTEATDPAYVSTMSPESGEIVLDQDGESVRLTNATSWFDVSKSTTGASTHPLDLDGDFSFSIVCTGPDGTDLYDETVTVTTDGQSGSVGPATDPALPLLPPGSTCEVEETVPAGWSVTSANPQSITTSSDGGAVAFTNQRQVADLTVTKVIEGLPVGLDPESFGFTVSVSCSPGFDANPLVLTDLTLTTAQPLVISDLPVGATCTVTETADPRFAATYDQAEVVIDVDGSALTITNSTGTFELVKVAQSSGVTTIDLAETFSFDVECERPDGTQYAATHTLTTGSGTAGTATASSPTPSLPILPAGTSCTATEQTPPAGWSLASPEPATFTISANQTPTAAFTNDRLIGDLTINKTLAGVPVDQDLGDEEFLADITCAGDFVSDPLVLTDVAFTANTPAIIPDLPAGAVCTVTEDPDSRFTTSYSTPAPDGLSSVVTVQANGSNVEVVNATGEIIVAKQSVVDPDHPIEWVEEFSYRIVCITSGGATAYDNLHTLTTSTATTTGGFGSIGWGELPPIPAGSTCTITEEDEDHWTLASPNSQQLSVDPNVATTASFVNERNVVDLTVRKAIEGLPADLEDTDYSFTVDLRCTGPFTEDPYLITDQTISVGSDLVVADLPTDATCSVAERPETEFSSSYSPDDGTGTAAELVLSDAPAASNLAEITNSVGTIGIFKSTSFAGSQPIDIVETFSFTVVCDNGLNSTHSVTTDGVAPEAGTGSTVVPPLPLLPAGTECTVSELSPPTGWTLDSPASVQLTVTTTGEQVANFANVRNTANLTVTKTIFGTPNGTDLNDDEFIVDVTCTGDFTASPLVVADQVVTVNTPLVIADLPTGATCSVVEDPDTRFVTRYSATSVEIDDDGADLGVINLGGELLVEKTTTFDSAHPLDPTATFEFTIVCSNVEGTEIYNEVHQLDAVITSPTTGFASVSYNQIPLLPNGATCTVTESSIPTGWVLTTPNDVVVSIDSAAPATASFTNERQTGELVITKELLGLPEGVDLSTAEFDVTVSCSGDFVTDAPDSAYEIVGTVSAATDMVITGLPSGAVCTVVEDPGYAFAVTATPANGEVTILADEQVGVDLVNRTGELMISKATEAPSTHPVDPTGVFEFRIECDNGPIPYAENVSINVDTLTASGAWGALRYDDLPLLPNGTTCDISETGGSEGWTLTSDETVTLVITSDGVQTASFTNSRDTADLTIEKVLRGVPAEIDLVNEPFEVTVTCTGDFSTAQPDQPYELVVTVSAQQGAVIKDLPTLADCTVAETEDPRFVASYEQAGQLDSDGETATITNETGSFAIIKHARVSSSHPATPQGSFNFDIVCVGPDGTELFNGSTTITTSSIDDTSASGTWGPPSTPLLPAGSTCEMSEQSNVEWMLVDRLGGPLQGENGFAIEVGVNLVEVEFTNERNVGSLTVTKSLAGLDQNQAVELENELFDVIVECSGRFGVDEIGAERVYQVPGPTQISAATELVIPGLPVGATCQVREVLDPRFTPTYLTSATGATDGSVIIAADGEPAEEPGGELAPTGVLTNHVHVTNSTGHLLLVKNTSTNSAVPIDLTGDFNFEVLCDNGYTGIHVVSVDAVVDGGMAGGLAANELAMLPTGTVCEVTEVDLPPTWVLRSDPTVTITIGSEPAVATFENERLTGSLALSKRIIDWPEKAEPATDSFPVTVRCEGSFVDGVYETEVQLGDGENVTIDGLPLGASCFVDEIVSSDLWEPAYDHNGTAIESQTIVVEGGQASTTNLAIVNSYVGPPLTTEPDPDSPDDPDPDGGSDPDSGNGSGSDSGNDEPDLAFTGPAHLRSLTMIALGLVAAGIAGVGSARRRGNSHQQ